MFAMLGISGLKAIVIGLCALAIVGTITAAALVYRGVLNENARLNARVAEDAVALQAQKAATDYAVRTVGEWADAAKKQQALLDEYSRTQQDAVATMRRLNDVLAKHDLRALAAAKPSLVERRVNDGSAAALRLLRDATDVGRPQALGPSAPGPSGPASAGTGPAAAAPLAGGDAAPAARR